MCQVLRHLLVLHWCNPLHNSCFGLPSHEAAVVIFREVFATTACRRWCLFPIFYTIYWPVTWSYDRTMDDDCSTKVVGLWNHAHGHMTLSVMNVLCRLTLKVWLYSKGFFSRAVFHSNHFKLHFSLRLVKDMDLRLFEPGQVKLVRIRLSESANHGKHISSGQIIGTSHDLTPNHGLVREIPLFQWTLGWWNIIVWPDLMPYSVNGFCGMLCYPTLQHFLMRTYSTSSHLQHTNS